MISLYLSTLSVYNELEKLYTKKLGKKYELLRLVQDGRVEGHALTPSCKNTRITTNC